MLKRSVNPDLSGKPKILIYLIVNALMVVSFPVYAQIFTNGDFETGDFTGWTITGPHPTSVVQHQGSWCGHIHIHDAASGSLTPNANWEMVSQSLFIPSLADSLNFYMELIQGGG